MNIKEKIMAVPNPYDESLSKDRFESMKIHCAEVAQEYVDKLELAEKYNFEVIQEINAGLEQQLLAERAKVDALIAEIDEVIFDEYSGGYFHRLDIGGAEITDVLDKYRSTGNESND